MRVINFFVLSLIICSRLFSQNSTTTHWYFGNFAGISFNTGIPISNTLGQIENAEGFATIGDSDGNLLFYSDGMEVYNRNHQLMPNGDGLMGYYSAAQILIIPFPGSDSLYYIFTVDAIENQLQEGLRYSIVDMSLEGGLGNITTQKNILLEGPVCEKLVAIVNSNNLSIWVIAHRWNSDEFVAYDVGSSGINTTPVVSAVGTVHMGGYSSEPDYNGYTNAGSTMTASVDGTRIGLAIYKMDKFELFDFNKTTGEISNCIESTFDYDDAYGVEFSPDGTKFYGATFSNYRVYQFDLMQPNPFDNPILIASPSRQPGAMQLGPDGKIYISEYLNTYLSVIQNPNELGLACNYQSMGVYLLGGTCRRGLPPLFYFKGYEFITGSEVEISVCDGDSVLINGSFESESGIFYETLQSSLGWDSILNITLEIIGGSHITINPHACGSYLSPSGNYTWTESGTYIDTISDFLGCDSIFTVNLIVGNSNSSSIDTTSCNFLTSPSGNYVWTESGVYEDVMQNNSGCDSLITINLTIYYGNDTIIYANSCDNYVSPSGNFTWTESGVYTEALPNSFGCDSVITVHLSIYGSEVTINEATCDYLVSPSGNYTWTESGTYIDTISDYWGCDSIITINLNLGNTTYSEIYPDACDYYVSPGGNTSLHESGTYFETITNSSGCDSLMTIYLNFNTSTNSVLNEIACNSYTSPSGIYTWTTSGTYFETIENVNGCDSNITVNLTVNYVDASVSQFGPNLIANAAGAIYQWVNCDNFLLPIEGETSQIFTPVTSGNYAVIVNQNNCTEISPCFYVISVDAENLANNSSTTIYPNPTSGQIFINGYNINKIELLNSLGCRLEQEIVVEKENNYSLNLESLSKGIYLIKIIRPDSIKIQIITLQ